MTALEPDARGSRPSPRQTGQDEAQAQPVCQRVSSSSSTRGKKRPPLAYKAPSGVYAANGAANNSSKESLPHSLSSSSARSITTVQSYTYSGSFKSLCLQRSPLRNTTFPPGDKRNEDGEAINELRNEMMVKWLYEQQLRKQYAKRNSSPAEGVVLKQARGQYKCYPPGMADLPDSLFEMAPHLNVRCAMTVNTPVVRAIIGSLRHEMLGYVPLPDGLRVQIVESMADLPKCQLHHFAAFVMDAKLLVVWAHDADRLLQGAQNLELRLVEIIWGKRSKIEEEDEDEPSEKSSPYVVEIKEPPTKTGEAVPCDDRPIRLESAFIVASTQTLCFVCLGLGFRSIVVEALMDGNWARMTLLGMTPLYWFISLFFFQALIGNLFRIFGPTKAVRSNSKYYSGKPPQRLDREQDILPHVTFQMPVHREGLKGVITPTIMSLKAAISTYEMQGGTANIFINDDGMQLISDDEAQLRRDFYEEHNIGWVARPPHQPQPDVEAGEKGFLRRGKFKKASNMNYALHVSNRVEAKLAPLARHSKWTQDDELCAYYQALADVLQEDSGRTWAEGNIRVGDYIMLVDADTRVPQDCLLDAVSEMEQSPEVALIQFTSGVMNVTESYFESGLTWFTLLIYSAITLAVALGDSCPFVGHNALLRWRSIQDAAAYTDEDGYEKYWSESHVSEDFDMALRLQVSGYTMRLASYAGDGFKEGVSLTVYDELARWEKYAYGCNELVFHPLRLWLFKGAVTPLFQRFLLSSIPLTTKLTIVAYIGTYYAIAAAWLILIINYFITGWYWDFYDRYYIDSFAIYISIIVVFTLMGNLTLAVLRFRLKEQPFHVSLWENIKWIPIFTVFLGGISLHIAQAILSHFFEIEMVWGATAKEVEKVNFGQEALRILRRFKYTFIVCIMSTTIIVAGCYFVPYDWRVDKFSSIFPLAMVTGGHFTLPLLLNPALMMFTY